MLGRQDEKFHQALAALQAGNGGGSWLDRVMKKRVIVHTRDSMSIEGVLMEHTDDGLIVRAAKLLKDGGGSTAMAGEVWIPRAQVAFAQLDE